MLLYFQLQFKAENRRTKIRYKLVTWKITFTVFNGIFLVKKKKKKFYSFLFINLKLIVKNNLSENNNPCFLFQVLGVMLWHLVCGFYLTGIIYFVYYVSINRFSLV